MEKRQRSAQYPGHHRGLDTRGNPNLCRREHGGLDHSQRRAGNDDGQIQRQRQREPCACFRRVRNIGLVDPFADSRNDKAQECAQTRRRNQPNNTPGIQCPQHILNKCPNGARALGQRPVEGIAAFLQLAAVFFCGKPAARIRGAVIPIPEQRRKHCDRLSVLPERQHVLRLSLPEIRHDIHVVVHDVQRIQQRFDHRLHVNHTVLPIGGQAEFVQNVQHHRLGIAHRILRPEGVSVLPEGSVGIVFQQPVVFIPLADDLAIDSHRCCHRPRSAVCRVLPARTVPRGYPAARSGRVPSHRSGRSPRW